MITFQQEPLYGVSSEIDGLLQEHYAELTLNKDRVKLNPRWSQYKALELVGAFVVFTARDGEKLVGYSAFFVQHHIHYADLVHAHNDVLFLTKEHRQGTAGIRLIKFCESQLKSIGVAKLTFHAKVDTSLIPILRRLGYQLEEVVQGKFL